MSSLCEAPLLSHPLLQDKPRASSPSSVDSDSDSDSSDSDSDTGVPVKKPSKQSVCGTTT